jgi:hypothetical protein
MAPDDCYPLPQLKSALNVRFFCDANTCDGRAEKAFTKWFSGTFPTPLLSLAEVYGFTKEIF